MKMVTWNPEKRIRGCYDPYTRSILELCNITANALFALDMDDEWITNVIYGTLGLPTYRDHFTLEQSWYELD